jgi:hypothetical protein
MGEKSKTAESYKPSGLHSIYRWIDRLPGPYWLFSIAFVLFTGLLHHIVAWNENVLPFGEINSDFALTGFQFGYFFFSIDFLFRVAKNSLIEFRPLLNLDDDEFNRIYLEFTNLPAQPTRVIFLIGAAAGIAIGYYLLPIQPGLNTAFPELEIPLYTITIAIIFVLFYMIIRALRLVNGLFEKVEKVDVFNQDSIYAISQYSAWLIIIISIQTSLITITTQGFMVIGENYALVVLFLLYFILLAILWIPFRGINRKLELEKSRLLIEVNQRIVKIIDLIHEKIDNQKFRNIVELKETLEGLKIEKEMIEAVHTLPWKSSTITGLVTALFLPLIVSLLTALITKYLNV